MTSRPPRSGGGEGLPELAWEDLLRRSGGDEGLACEVLGEMRTLLAGAGEALASVTVGDDAAAVARAAHKVRGALVTSGLSRAAWAAAAVEAAGSEATREEAVASLRGELARAGVAVERCLVARGSLPAGPPSEPPSRA